MKLRLAGSIAVLCYMTVTGCQKATQDTQTPAPTITVKDVYVAGLNTTAPTMYQILKNGVEVPLTNGNERCICLGDSYIRNDVYVAGDEFKTAEDLLQILKNGVRFRSQTEVTTQMQGLYQFRATISM